MTMLQRNQHSVQVEMEPVGGKYSQWGFKYEVTDDGRVWNSISKSFISRCKNSKGYLYCLLIYDNKRQWCTVHQLVLHTFTGMPPNNKYECNHKDGDKTNNTIGNLEWMTHAENIQHSLTVIKTKPVGETGPNAKYSRKTLRKARRLLKKGGLRLMDIAKMCGTSTTWIGKVSRGETRRHD